MRFIDLFAGVGGFRLGLERGSHECVWSCEVDKYARQVYRYHWDGGIAGDIRKVDTDNIPKFDILCAGFPCQAFSVSGKMRGFEDSRGTLFFEICRVLRDKRPAMVFLENVKGLLAHDKHRTFRRIVESLRELGYVGQYQVLNTESFGIPQHRERVFIIGYFGEESRRGIFPLGENHNAFKEKLGISHRKFKNPKSVCEENNINEIIVHSLQKRQHPGCWSPGHAMRGNATYALDTWNFQAVEVEGRLRNLTPLECERLQGFPDDWTKWGIDENGERITMTNNQRYKMMGNAVTVKIIEEIGKAI